MAGRPVADELVASISAYRQLPPLHQPSPTLLQVAGVAHLEDIASNILGFLLNPIAEHGLGSLFLDTLLHLLGAEHPYDATVVQVEREVPTPEGKRLDLVIDTGEMVVGIEHKINHQPVNPFALYAAHLQKLAQGRPFLGVLLALHPGAATLALHGFRPLTLRAFYGAVEAREGPYLAGGREPYLTLYRDFVTTMRNPNQEVLVDAQRVAFLAEHRASVEALLADVDKLQRYLSKQLLALQKCLAVEAFPMPIQSGFSYGHPRLFQILYYHVALGQDIELRINVNYSPDGWRINLMDPSADTAAGLARLASWCAGKEIQVRQLDPGEPPVFRLRYGNDGLGFDADLALIQDEVQALLDRVRQSLVDGNT